jgi:hypothetical protein
METLDRLRVDLKGQNYRSGDREIVAFGNDILFNRPRFARTETSPRSAPVLAGRLLWRARIRMRC